MPIPYQKSCKVVADEGWGSYYHFTYSTFPKGTKVPTFSAALAAENAAALQKVNDFFKDKLGKIRPATRGPGDADARASRSSPGETVAWPSWPVRGRSPR